MVVQKVKNLALKWLRSSEWTAEEVAKGVCVKHFVVLLSYKPKRWVTCHQLCTLEDAVLLMEAYISAEVGIYLKKNLQKQAARTEQAKGSQQ